MSNRRSLLWAVAASVALHLGIGVGLGRLPSSPCTAPASQQRPTMALYASAGTEREETGKLAPGDRREKGAASLPMPGAPGIQVEPATGNGGLGSALPEGSGGPATGTPGGGGAGLVSGEGPIEFFGVRTEARRVVYVLDRSCSMGFHDALRIACQELLSSLKRLPATSRFQVVLYNSSPELLLANASELVPATADNLTRAAVRLDTVTATGGTRPLGALQLALGLRPDVIYFLTDADDLTEADYLQVTRANAGRSVLNTIELTTAHRGQLQMPMQRLARDNGGQYQALNVLP